MSEEMKQAVEHCEKVVRREARSAAEKLMAKTGDSFWREFGSYRASNPHEKPANPLDGAIAKGGGSKSGRKKKSPKGNKVIIGIWDGI